MLNKIAVAEIAPFLLAGIRFTIAGLLIFVLAKLMGHSLKITKKQLVNTIIAGFLFLTFGNGLAVWALQYVDSNFVALEISAQPLIVLLMMWALQGKKISSMSLIGIALGISGIFILASQDEMVTSKSALIGFLMVLLAMLGWAYGSLFVGKADLPQNYFINTGYQMLVGGLMLFIASFALQEPLSAPVNWSGKVAFSVVALIIFGSIIAFTSFNFLLTKVSPEKVATNTYVNPIVAIVLGWYFLDEKITITTIIAAIVLLTGVFFINSGKTLKLPKKSRRRWV
jgi:drug/metabolite transporter (DMT)-like permease